MLSVCTRASAAPLPGDRVDELVWGVLSERGDARRRWGRLRSLLGLSNYSRASSRFFSDAAIGVSEPAPVTCPPPWRCGRLYWFIFMNPIGLSIVPGPLPLGVLLGHLIRNTQRNSSRRAKPAQTVPPHKTTPVENTMGNRLTDTWLRLTPCQKAQSGQRHGPNLGRSTAPNPAGVCLADAGPEFAP